MGLLRAPVDYLKPLTVDVREAFPLVAELFVTKDIVSIKVSCDGIAEEMDESPLSKWFSLFVRVVFRHVYEDDVKYRALLGAVSRLCPPGSANNTADLAGLRELAVTQTSDVSRRLGKLRQEQKSLMGLSYSAGLNGASRLDRDTELTTEIAALEEQIKPRLALFIIVEKIIVILEELKSLKVAREMLTKQKIIKDPVRFIADLIPILRLLQKGKEADLKHVIKLTLQLVDIEDPRLASRIQKELLRRKWLELVAPREAQEPQETEERNCLVRAFSHLFFRQRRGRVVPAEEPQQMEAVRAALQSAHQKMGELTDEDVGGASSAHHASSPVLYTLDPGYRSQQTWRSLETIEEEDEGCVTMVWKLQ